MRAKDMILDFINLIFYIVLIYFSIIFVISGNNFETFVRTMEYYAPIVLFMILCLFKLKLNRREFKSRTKGGNLDMVLRLSFNDKIMFDLILFLVPVIILAIPLLAGASNSIDLIQALIVFIIFYFWQKYLFNKDSQ